MTKDEALKLALEALEVANSCVDGYYIPKGRTQLPEIELAITAIKEALAQPEQEPVTWRYKIVDVFGRPVWTLKTPKSDTRVLESQPLYTTPPQRKPLSDEEISVLRQQHGITSDGRGIKEWTRVVDFARAIEAAVWEKQK